MNAHEITFDVNGVTADCWHYKTDVRILKAFVGMDSGYEMFEEKLMAWVTETTLDRVWFTIPIGYDLSFSDRHNWYVHDKFVNVNGEWRVLVYYAADGKHFINDLEMKDMPPEMIEALDVKFPGISPNIIRSTVDEFVVRRAIIHFVNGRLQDSNIQIDNPKIDLVWVTPFVKAKLGRKFAASHLFALRAFKKILNENNKN
jgi:hypothetical protein